MVNHNPNGVKDIVKKAFIDNCKLSSLIKEKYSDQELDERFESFYTQLTVEFNSKAIEKLLKLKEKPCAQLGKDMARSFVSAVNNLSSLSKDAQEIIDFSLYSLRTDLSNTLDMRDTVPKGSQGSIDDRFIADVRKTVPNLPAANIADLGFALMTHFNHYLATHQVPDEKIEAYYQTFQNSFSGMLKSFQKQGLPFNHKHQGVDKLVFQSIAQAASVFANHATFQKLSSAEQIRVGEKIVNQFIAENPTTFKSYTNAKEPFPTQDRDAKNAYVIISTMNKLLIASGKKQLDERSRTVTFSKENAENIPNRMQSSVPNRTQTPSKKTGPRKKT